MRHAHVAAGKNTKSAVDNKNGTINKKKENIALSALPLFGL